ncbi:MAG: sigma-70 family RNA polymerase sigma factor [Planctomycetota bacterium]
MTNEPSLDHRALERLFGSADWLHGCAIRLGYGPQSADDAVQETLLMAARGGESPRGRGWLRVALRNRLGSERTRSRRRLAREERAARPESQHVSPSEALERAELGRRLRRALEALPRRDREVLVLRFFAELSPKEIAESLGETPNAVSSRLTRALKKIRAELTDEDRPGSWMAALLWPVLTPRTPSAPSSSSLAAVPTALPTTAAKSTMSKHLLALAVTSAAGFMFLLPGTSAPADGGSLPPTASTELHQASSSEEGRGDGPAVAGSIESDPERTVLEADALETATSQPPPTAGASGLGAVALTVVDMGSGQGVEGVPVELVRNFGQAPWSQTRLEETGPGGLAVFEDVAPGSAVAHVAGAGYGVTMASEKVHVEVDVTTEIRVELDPSQRVRGRVVDEAGQPVEGASIWVGHRGGPTRTGSVAALSGADGGFELLYTSRMQFVSASKDGHAPSPCRSGSFPLVPEEEVPFLELTLGSQHGAISGVVLGPQGEPVAGARVALGNLQTPLGGESETPSRDWSAPARMTTTGADGLFRIDHAVVGETSLFVRAVGTALWERSVVVVERTNTDVEVRLQAGGTLVGVVRQADGEPAAQARVEVDFRGTRPFARMETTTDEEGRFRLEHLTPGECSIDAFDSEWKSKVVVEVEILDGTETSVEIELPARVPFHGQLRSASGEPLEGWYVTTFGFVDGVQRSQSLMATADAEGRFAYFPEGGDIYRVEVHAPQRWGAEPSFVIDSVVLEAESLDLVVPDEVIPSAALKGRFVLESGEVVGALFDLELMTDPPTTISEMTDLDGSFHLRYLDEVGFELRARVVGLRPLLVESDDALDANETRDLGTLTMRRE